MQSAEKERPGPEDSFVVHLPWVRGETRTQRHPWGRSRETGKPPRRQVARRSVRSELWPVAGEHTFGAGGRGTKEGLAGAGPRVPSDLLPGGGSHSGLEHGAAVASGMVSGRAEGDGRAWGAGSSDRGRVSVPVHFSSLNL